LHWCEPAVTDELVFRNLRFSGGKFHVLLANDMVVTYDAFKVTLHQTTVSFRSSKVGWGFQSRLAVQSAVSGNPAGKRPAVV
jgi:hypothetical protein